MERRQGGGGRGRAFKLIKFNSRIRVWCPLRGRDVRSMERSESRLSSRMQSRNPQMGDVHEDRTIFHIWNKKADVVVLADMSTAQKENATGATSDQTQTNTTEGNGCMARNQTTNSCGRRRIATGRRRGPSEYPYSP